MSSFPIPTVNSALPGNADTTEFLVLIWGKFRKNSRTKEKNIHLWSFYKEATGLNMDDYISLTSFTHHPFYTQFALEVPDNWIGEMSYNIPLDELMDVLDKAIDKGYSFSWGSDVSERGFSRDGIAIVPTADIKDMSNARNYKMGSLFLKKKKTHNCINSTNRAKKKKLPRKCARKLSTITRPRTITACTLSGKAVRQAD